MSDWLNDVFKFFCDVPKGASSMWRRRFRKIRKANIPVAERDIFERYGENVIAQMLASGLSPRAKEIQLSDEQVEHARDWLTERADTRDRREQWVSTRDLILEIIVISLIGWEIHMNYRQEQLQSTDFQKQQEVLTNLESSSATTANTLAALQRTTELMNTALQMQLDAIRKSETQAERSAKAGEASASTASQALHVSERAYVHMRALLTKPPAVSEKLQVSVSILNSGRTPAVDLALNSRAILVSGPPVPELGVEAARKDAFAIAEPKWQSETTLPAGQTTEAPIDMHHPLTQPEFDELTQGKAWLYIFATVSYKDVFGRVHHSEMCGIYEPTLKAVQDCHGHNKSD